jgi:hypothetical protein
MYVLLSFIAEEIFQEAIYQRGISYATIYHHSHQMALVIIDTYSFCTSKINGWIIIRRRDQRIGMLKLSYHYHWCCFFTTITIGVVFFTTITIGVVFLPPFCHWCSKSAQKI